MSFNQPARRRELGYRNLTRKFLRLFVRLLRRLADRLLASDRHTAKSGEPYRISKKHFGPNGCSDIIVANGPTKLFNETIPQSTIDAAYEEDPLEAASEWGGEFHNAKDAYISPEAVEACIDRGVYQRLYEPGKQYLAHVDASGGSEDSFTLAIGHLEGCFSVLDYIGSRRRNSPQAVVTELSDACKSYHVHRVVGDAYSGEFVRELFRKNLIEYKIHDEPDDTKTTTSQCFGSFLPVLNSRRCRLLDNKQMVREFVALERRPECLDIWNSGARRGCNRLRSMKGMRI